MAFSPGKMQDLLSGNYGAFCWCFRRHRTVLTCDGPTVYLCGVKFDTVGWMTGRTSGL